MKIVDAFFNLGNLEADCLKNRFLILIWFLGMILSVIILIVIVITYMLLGIFILDWIYWVFSGRTVLWKLLMN